MSTDVPPSSASAGRVPEDPYASDPDRPLASAARPWWRWLFLVPGFAAVGWGVLGLVQHRDRVPLDAWATWFVGSALVHDLLIAPAVIAVGAVLARVLPRPARAPVVVGLVVSAVLTVVALPFLYDGGDNSSKPSFLVQDYDRNLLLLVVGVLTVAGLWAVVATLRARRRGDPAR